MSTWDNEAPGEIPPPLGALSGVMCPSCPATELRWEAAHTALICPSCHHWQVSPGAIERGERFAAERASAERLEAERLAAAE